MLEKYQCINFYFFMTDILEVPTDEMQANLYLTYFCCTETSLMQTEARYETILNKFQYHLDTSFLAVRLL